MGFWKLWESKFSKLRGLDYYHFSIISETLLENTVQEDIGHGCCSVAGEFFFTEHAIVVLIKVQILALGREAIKRHL